MTIESQKLIIRTKNSVATICVKWAIMEMDSESYLVLESNPVTIWVNTRMTVGEVMKISGVVDVIVSSDNRGITGDGESRSKHDSQTRANMIWNRNNQIKRNEI